MCVCSVAVAPISTQSNIYAHHHTRNVTFGDLLLLFHLVLRREYKYNGEVVAKKSIQFQVKSKWKGFSKKFCLTFAVEN